MFRGVIKVASTLSLFAGVLSLTLLTKQALNLGIVAPLQLILDWYGQSVEFLLGWLDEPANQLLNQLNDLIHLEFDLQPYWKHVFVLVWLYFGSDSKVYWEKNQKGYSAFSLVFGALCAFLGSIASGAILPTNENAEDLIFLFPVAAIIMYELGITWYNATFIRAWSESKTWLQTFVIGFFSFVFPALFIAAVVFAANKFLLLLPELPGIAWLGLYILGLAIYWLIRSVWKGFYDRKKGETWLARFSRSSGTRIGRIMFKVFFGSVIFIALNAGLKLAGL